MPTANIKFTKEIKHQLKSIINGSYFGYAYLKEKHNNVLTS